MSTEGVGSLLSVTMGWEGDRCQDAIFASRSRTKSTGLWIPWTWWSAETFVLLTDIASEFKVSIALGMYALYRTVQYLGHHSESSADPMRSLRANLCKAHGGSKASVLFRP